MRTLVIGDIHHKWEKAEKIIKRVYADEIVFLGDYFDDFNDGAEEMRSTCEWFEFSLKQKNRIHLIGNHDAPYFWHNPRLNCPGYAPEKEAVIWQELRELALDKLKFFYYNNNVLFSHAGFSRYHCNDINNPINQLNRDAVNAFELMRHSSRGHWFYQWGFARGGNIPVGGLLWCDYREFQPIPGLAQVFGHTPARTPRFVNESNLCIDCFLDYVAMVEDGKIEVLKFV